MSPEAPDLRLLADDHENVRRALGLAREGRQGGFAARLQHRDFADERHAFDASLPVAAGVEGAAVERALQAVVAYEAAHYEGVGGPLVKEGEHFARAAVVEGSDSQGISVDDARGRCARRS